MLQYKVITVNVHPGEPIGLGIKRTSGGLVVDDVAPGGTAARAGIEAGQLIVAVNGMMAMEISRAQCMAIISAAAMVITLVIVHVVGPPLGPQAVRIAEQPPPKRARVNPSTPVSLPASIDTADVTAPFKDYSGGPMPSHSVTSLCHLGSAGFPKSLVPVEIDSSPSIDSLLATMPPGLASSGPELPLPLLGASPLHPQEGGVPKFDRLDRPSCTMPAFSSGFDKKITFQRYTPDSSKKLSKKLKFPPQQRYLRFTEEEWEANIKGAITASFGRFRAVDGKSSSSTAKLVDRLLARVVTGAGKVECRSGSRRKKPCFWLKRKKVGSQAPFQVKISGTRMVAQKAVFAAYNGLKAHDIGTWQVEQSCCHNDTEWWCFEPSHLQRCVKDHVRPGIVKRGIPGPPHAILNS